MHGTGKHINYAQALLKQQISCVGGLQSTLFQYKKNFQIIHCHGCHWVVAHKEDYSSNVIDSLFDEVDDIIKKVVTNLFSLFSDRPVVEVVLIQKLCGVFAVAVCVAVLLKENPGEIIFNEDQMKPQMCSCFEQKVMINFPRSQYTT